MVSSLRAFKGCRDSPMYGYPYPPRLDRTTFALWPVGADNRTTAAPPGTGTEPVELLSRRLERVRRPLDSDSAKY